MAWYILDMRDRVAQEVTADTDCPKGWRFQKIEADGVKEAVKRAADRIKPQEAAKGS